MRTQRLFTGTLVVLFMIAAIGCSNDHSSGPETSDKAQSITLGQSNDANEPTEEDVARGEGDATTVRFESDLGKAEEKLAAADEGDICALSDALSTRLVPVTSGETKQTVSYAGRVLVKIADILGTDTDEANAVLAYKDKMDAIAVANEFAPGTLDDKELVEAASSPEVVAALAKFNERVNESC